MVAKFMFGLACFQFPPKIAPQEIQAIIYFRADCVSTLSGAAGIVPGTTSCCLNTIDGINGNSAAQLDT